MIRIENLHASYGTNHVLNGLSLRLSGQQVHGLVGLNGSGKTTLLKCMAGLQKYSGAVLGASGSVLAKSTVSLLETEPYLYPGITGREYLSLFQVAGKSPFDTEAWAELFHLPVDKLTDTYSTGMKRKLAILGMIRLDRNIFLLDEPFNGLDLESVRVLLIAIGKLKQLGKTILLTSHILETLTQVCDEIHMLHDGVIRKSFPASEFHTVGTEIYGDLDAVIRSRMDRLI